jgi:hypothetical protein
MGCVATACFSNFKENGAESLNGLLYAMLVTVVLVRGGVLLLHG